MKFFFSLVFLSVVSLPAMGSGFDPLGPLECRTPSRSYNDLQVLNLSEVGQDGFRSAYAPRLGYDVPSACEQNTVEIRCKVKKFKIIVDLTTVQSEWSANVAEVTGYKVTGSVDTFWQGEEKLNCFQKLADEAMPSGESL